MFDNSSHKGNMQVTKGGNFQIQFANGYCLSIGISRHHYCQSHVSVVDFGTTTIDRDIGVLFGATDCEVAVISPSGNLTDIQPHDQVIARVTPEQLARLINIVSKPNFKPRKNIEARIRKA